MSIIPGIDTAAPERTETSSGSPRSPRPLPVVSSRRARCSSISSSRPCRKLLAGPHVLDAGLRRDREAGRNGNAERRHLGETCSLATEQLTTEVGTLREVVDEACHGRSGSFHTREGAKRAARRSGRAPRATQPRGSPSRPVSGSRRRRRGRGRGARSRTASKTTARPFGPAGGGIGFPLMGAPRGTVMPGLPWRAPARS